MSTVVFVGTTVPDVVNLCRGKISGREFAENTTSNAASVGGGWAGASAGAAIGSAICPGVGTVIGGIVGGLGGGMGAALGVKKIFSFFNKSMAGRLSGNLNGIFFSFFHYIIMAKIQRFPYIVKFRITKLYLLQKKMVLIFFSTIFNILPKLQTLGFWNPHLVALLNVPSFIESINMWKSAIYTPLTK